MAIRWAAIIAGLAAGTVMQAGQPRQTVTVYVRAWNAPNTILVPAKELATKMFARIGIYLDWHVRKPIPASAKQAVIIELVMGTPENTQPGALAYSQPYEGNHITVFFDRIEATHWPAKVLAHVMVHEITHLLQGFVRHSDAGIMKARWTPEDLFQIGYKPLSFTANDVNLIYSGLAARRAATGAGEGNSNRNHGRDIY